MVNKKRLAPLALAVPLSLLAIAPAYAQDDSQTYQGTLNPLNDSGTSGQAWVIVNGRQATVKVNVSGAVEGAPHAQHFHIGGQNTCPGPEAAGEDGIISTVDGKPAYGGIKASLTVEGDYSPKSALAVKRFPTGGSYTYERTIDLSTLGDNLASQLDGAVIVVHGIDTINPSGKYDGEPKSQLKSSLPLEATAPTACAELSAAPAGAMQTGNGGAADDGVDAALLGVGGVLLAAAGGSFFVARRRRTDS